VEEARKATTISPHTLQSRNLKHLDSPKFLFVAHGIGSWIVKNALARYDNLLLSLETAGVIFIDMGLYDPETFDYPEYLVNIAKTFHLRESTVSVSRNDLTIRLRDIDENWENLGLSKSKYVEKYRVMSITSKLADLKMVNASWDKVWTDC
jgi:pimeloyl-ACP methyl ester carboxylesterase